MNFLSIPNEMIDGGILPYLKWNDLLRFRRVCKATKAITQAYMMVHPELAPEIEIGEDDARRSFGAFLKMGIPTNRIFLNNQSGDEFYEKDRKDMCRFLGTCGPLIKHLRVKQLSYYPYGTEWDFMEALMNLESFEAAHFGLGARVITPQEVERALNANVARFQHDPRFWNAMFPLIFERLRSLRIGQQECVKISNITNVTRAFLETGQDLENVSLPFNSHFATTPWYTVPEGQHPYHSLAIAFNHINGAIQQRAVGYPQKSNLKTFDFSSYHDEGEMDAVHMQTVGSAFFLELLKHCVQNGVQVKNVGCLWFSVWGEYPYPSSPDLGIPVLSLINLNPCILSLNMPNLERVEIRSLSLSSPGPQLPQQLPYWPALKSVDITVDCKEIHYVTLFYGETYDPFYQDAKIIFQFFFQNVQRTNLTELRLNFIIEFEQVAVPGTDDIVASCPNLKKITLINWPGTNQALIKFWDGLPALEEISLEYCRELGNEAFVGEDAMNPVFFKLNRLRKLSLKGLDQMPKITDILFSLVLRNLSLTHLILTSDLPVKSVTSAGILSLLQGNFAEKIAKFPFQHWSLDGVSAEEFMEMEVKFRSYNML